MYPVVFFDALRVKIRDEGVVRNKAIYLALAILPDGTRDNLGLWIEQTEGAKFWMKVFSDRLVNPADPLKSLPGSSVARRYRHHALGGRCHARRVILPLSAVLLLGNQGVHPEGVGRPRTNRV
ncbi:transposase, mutator type [Caballeronia turbans]|jgi:hypothetical protein|nr:transposase, mutator type [Caballeronia turbans]